MKSIIISFKMLTVMSILTGAIYPALIWGYSNLFVQNKALGSLVQKKSIIVGSELIGQKFTKPSYFWSRPSAIDYNPASSGASNLGPTSSDLKKQVDARATFLSGSHAGVAPKDLIFASASGLDPHISVESVNYQIPRVAKNRGISVSTLQHLVQELTEKPQYGIFGETRINVLKLNLALDSISP